MANKKTKLHANLDQYYKETLDAYFQEFVEFCNPTLYDMIDWSVAPIQIDKELVNIARMYAKNKGVKHKSVDKLVQVRLKNGDDRIVYVHVEAQGKLDEAFSERMFIYYSLLYLKLEGRQITSVAILTDDIPTRPPIFSHSFQGTEITFKFSYIVVAEMDEEVLKASNNIFALSLLANLYVQRSKTSAAKRLDYKKTLVKLAHERGISREKVESFLIFVRILMALPSDYEKLYMEFVEEYSEIQNSDDKMPKMTMYELGRREFADYYIQKELGITLAQVKKQVVQAKRQAEKAEKAEQQAAQKIEQAQQQAEQAQQQAEQAQQQAEQAQQQMEQAAQKIEQAAQKIEQAQQEVEQTKQQAEQKIEQAEQQVKAAQEQQAVFAGAIRRLYFNRKMSVQQIVEEFLMPEPLVLQVIEETTDTADEDTTVKEQ